MTTEERLAKYLKDHPGIHTARWLAFKHDVNESTVYRAMRNLVLFGRAVRTLTWEDQSWHYRRAGYIRAWRYPRDHELIPRRNLR